MDQIRHALLTAVAVAALACGGTINVDRQAPGPTPVAVDPAPPAIASPGPTVAVRTTGPEITEVFCGTLSPNTILSGQGSGSNVVELRPATSERTGAISSTRFGWTDPPPFGTYVCVSLALGAPFSGFRSAIAPGDSAYIAEIVPTGFVLPPSCRYVGLPTVPENEPAVIWKFDCGVSANRDARGALRAAFTQQGWISCASGLATEIWRKDLSRLTIAEGSGSPNEYPTMTQRLFYTGGGGPANAGCP